MLGAGLLPCCSHLDPHELSARQPCVSGCSLAHSLPAAQVRVVRIFNTYGPRMALDDGRVVSNFLAQVRSCLACNALAMPCAACARDKLAASAA